MKKLIMSVVAIATLSVTGSNANSFAEKMLNPNDFKGLLEVNKDQICGQRAHGDVRNILNSRVDFPERSSIIMANAHKREHQEKLRNSNGDERLVEIKISQQLNKTFVDEKTGITYSVNAYDPIGGIIQLYSSSRGEISLDLLKQLGETGMTTKLGWAQFIRNYLDFNNFVYSNANLKYYKTSEAVFKNNKNLSKERSYQLNRSGYNQLALYLYSIYIEDMEGIANRANFTGKEADKFSAVMFLSEGMGMDIDQFLDFLNKHKHNAKLKKLFKDVILYKKDNEEILEYIKKENERSGVAEILEEMEIACYSPSAKTIGDVIKLKTTWEQVEKEHKEQKEKRAVQQEQYNNELYEKVKNKSKITMCTGETGKIKLEEEEFTDEEIREYLFFKDKPLTEDRRKESVGHIYAKFKNLIIEDIKNRISKDTKHLTLHNQIFEDACNSETTKTVDDVKNYTKYEFNEFKKQDKKIVCNVIEKAKEARYLDIEKIIFISKQNGKEKTIEDVKKACDAWFGVSTIGDIINY
ncbi:hypothetical protein [Aliarcobacter cryaerophilus]|uniref:hypothetical protein n=1 Tax=Aliarcobacter cryaerophilus TaxID=28198 RepID=UPI0021B24D0C|nr:hypothetical protein [Aliarcobacter cryaerophilus]MCT7510968.1 hypothetical protein [Aliarcobacter cryaerophilus]